MAPSVALEGGDDDDDRFLDQALQEFLQCSVAARHGGGETVSENREQAAAISYPRLHSSGDVSVAAAPEVEAEPAVVRAQSTPQFSALARLLATDSPTVFRELLEYEREERGARERPDAPLLLAGASARVMFATEARRWLELAHASSADTKSVLLERARLDDEHLIDFDLVSTVNRPAFFTCVVPEMRAVVLSVRSTKSITDLMTDYNYEPDSFLDGAAHSGMAKAARWFAANIAPRLAVMREMYPNTRLRLVGHSLGAGVVSLLCLLLRTTRIFRDVEAICFAPPACISSELGALAAACTTSIVNGDDFLPFMSLNQQPSLFGALLAPLASLRSTASSPATVPAAAVPASAASGVTYPQLTVGDDFVLLEPSVTPPPSSHAPPPPPAAEVERLSPALSAAQLTTSTELSALRTQFATAPATDAKARELHLRRTFCVPGRIWHMRKGGAEVGGAVAIEAQVPASRFSTFPRISLDTINQHRKAAYFEALDAIV